jgi:serine/threonine protein kinase
MSLSIQNQAEPIAGYRLLERIGGGGFGEVWKAEAPGGLLKAIKIIHGDLRTADLDGARHAEQELRALKRVQAIRHPYLLSLERYDVVEGRLLIVMELADGNLWDRFRDCRTRGQPGIPRSELLRYLEESAEVLDLLNNQYGLQHLDIKPQNLFLIHNHVKVADFGLVKDLEGMRAALTGGVTPVYAAPETFEGIASRYCDQYSLAIVYQELLTGVRPFNGANAQQLLVQHLQGLPNLAPLPAADRPAIGRALSKKPENRFPSCLEFVQGLQQGVAELGGPALVTSPSNRAETPREPLPQPDFEHVNGFAPAEPPPETPRTELRFKRDEKIGSSPLIGFDPTAVPAPPEETGTGALVPAVIVGIGQVGIDVLREFRRQIAERFGSFDRLPHLRLIALDTDPETLQKATASSSGSPLMAGEAMPMRLNRASHYLKPRRNGRSLIEGWFDPQLLYRIPRNPQTLAMRCLGRLAFFDHYRTFAAKLNEELEACATAAALSQSDRNTSLGLRNNRPRVYVVAGLGGGTGSGMFIDVAYAARHKLRKLGYADPEVIGMLLTPTAERTAPKTQAVANAFAALKELNHYSLTETCFTAIHDDRDGTIRDPGPPFRRFMVAPLEGPTPAANETSEPDKATGRTAEQLRRELLSPLGRVADESRAEFAESTRPGPVTACIANEASYLWPKQAILSRGVRWLGDALVSRWLKADIDTIREPVHNWLKERWSKEELGPETIVARLRQKAEKAVGGRPLDEYFGAEAQPYVSRSWFSRDPDSGKLWQTVCRLLKLVGMPDEQLMQRQSGALEQALAEAGDDLARDWGARVARLPRTLLEHADYRLGGAEHAVEQLQGNLTEQIQRYSSLASEASGKAIAAYYVVSGYLADDVARRKPSPAEVVEGLRSFPKHRCDCLIFRQVARVSTSILGQLGDFARELLLCRDRLKELRTRLRRPDPELVLDRDTTLLPPGCDSVDRAVRLLRDSIQTDELRSLDKLLQKQIENAYQALFSVCMSSINMLGNLEGVIEEQARNFLAKRLGETDLGAMFLDRFPDADAGSKAIRAIHDKATPLAKLDRPPSQEITLVAVPDGEVASALQRVVRQALPGRALDFTTSTEEVMVYREWPRFPLTELPALSRAAETAYNQLQQSSPGVAHTRIDVSRWADF